MVENWQTTEAWKLFKKFGKSGVLLLPISLHIVVFMFVSHDGPIFMLNHAVPVHGASMWKLFN